MRNNVSINMWTSFIKFSVSKRTSRCDGFLPYFFQLCQVFNGKVYCSKKVFKERVSIYISVDLIRLIILSLNKFYNKNSRELIIWNKVLFLVLAFYWSFKPKSRRRRVLRSRISGQVTSQASFIVEWVEYTSSGCFMILHQLQWIFCEKKNERNKKKPKRGKKSVNRAREDNRVDSRVVKVKLVMRKIELVWKTCV